MGAPTWASDQETTWLESHLETFRSKRTEGEVAVSSFITATQQAYFDRFYPHVVLPPLPKDAKPRAKSRAKSKSKGMGLDGGMGESMDEYAKAEAACMFEPLKVDPKLGPGPISLARRKHVSSLCRTTNDAGH